MKFAVLVLLLSGAMAFAQAPAPTPSPTPVPKGEVVTPKPIEANGSKMSGDVAVIADLADLLTIVDDYKNQEKALLDKLSPGWNAAQDKIRADIAAVKKANGWGDDVTFDPQTKKWYRIPQPTKK